MAGRVIVWSPVIRLTAKAHPRQYTMPVAGVVGFPAEIIPFPIKLATASAQVQAQLEDAGRLWITRITANYLMNPEGLEKVFMRIVSETLQNVTRGDRRTQIESSIIRPLQQSVLTATHKYGPPNRIGKPIKYTGGLAGSIGYRSWTEDAAISATGLDNPIQFKNRVWRIGAPLRGENLGDSPDRRAVRAYAGPSEYGSRFRVPLDPSHPGYQRIAAWAAAKLGSLQPPRSKKTPRRKKTLGRPRKYGDVSARAIRSLIMAMRKNNVQGSHVLRDTFNVKLPGLARSFFVQVLTPEYKADFNQAVKAGLQPITNQLARVAAERKPKETVINIVVG